MGPKFSIHFINLKERAGKCYIIKKALKLIEIKGIGSEKR